MTSVENRTVRIAAAQTAEYRGDVGGAIRCLIDVVKQAVSQDVKLICFPEGFLQGYLTEETSARRAAMDLASSEFLAILEQFPAGPMLVIGMIEMEGDNMFNTAVVVQDGSIVGRYRKAHLMGGESAFRPGTDSPIFVVDGLRFGINICYDANYPIAAAGVAAGGASLIVCPANNMMQSEKAEQYRDLHNAIRGDRCRETNLWLISADVIGARDGRVALGPTAVLNPVGEVEAQLPLGKAGLLVFDLPVCATASRPPSA